MPSEQPDHRKLYEAVKQDLLAGVFAPRERIDLQSIGDRYRVSTTPIREILSQLQGERLIEHFPFGGFQPRHPDARELHDLYGWFNHHLLAALHLLPEALVRQVIRPAASSLIAHPTQDPVDLVERLSIAIGNATGNGEFVTQIGAANERLRRARVAESQLFADRDRELASMVKINGFNVKNNVRRRLIAYHRRRFDHAAQIAALID